MTFSIVAKDPDSSLVGVAIASRFLAAGAYCIHGVNGVGAGSSQAKANPFHGIDAMAGMAKGEAVAPLLARLMQGDEGRDRRQVHLVDMAGNSAAWTGADCVDWAGHKTYAGFSVAGNMLAGGQVIEAMAGAYGNGGALSFPLRLLAAMDAGEGAGGDKRGKQSAAIFIIGDQEYAELDLRVDDHPDPLPELRRIFDLSRSELMLGFRAQMLRRG
ncbi:MAG: DUF1028 domain-containing protein [Alphaproteobacteria bacterium]